MSKTDITTDRRLAPREKIDLQTSIKVRPDSSELIKTGFQDFDAMLGGGLTPGKKLLLGAMPGTGKTTLGLQILGCAARQGHRGLFVSTEMSAPFVASYMERLGVRHRDIYISESDNFRHVMDLTYEHAPRIVVVDSIQGIHDPQATGQRGGVVQLKAIIALMDTIPDEVTFIFLGRATKAGRFAGTQDLPHMVDQVMWMAKDPLDDAVRQLTWDKNRCGSTSMTRTLMMGTRGFANYITDDSKAKTDDPNAIEEIEDIIEAAAGEA